MDFPEEGSGGGSGKVNKTQGRANFDGLAHGVPIYYHKGKIITSFHRGSTYHVLGFVPRSLKPNFNQTVQTWEAYQRVSNKLEFRSVSPSLALVQPMVHLLIFFAIIVKARFLTCIPNICWIIEKAREFQKNIYFCFLDYAKAFDCVDHSKLWKILKEMGIPDHLICLLSNLYAGSGSNS